MSFFFSKKEGPQKIETKEGYDHWATHYASEKNPIKSASDEVIKKMMPDLIGKKIIDAGCGSGFFCEYAEQHKAREIIGIDFSLKMVEEAKKICRYTTFLAEDIRSAELPANTDVIISALVLGHMEKIEPVIEKFSRALKKDGTLLLSDFHPFLSLSGQKRTFQLRKQHYEVSHFIHLLSEYINLLTQSGLTVVQMEEPAWNGTPVIFALKAKKI